ncbi:MULTISPECIES: L-serine ammonia-lyase, iron-sulfur-dependent subunit beta [Megasphaera]|uniref:L-serine deaminase n=1 Tax=Megasphaera hutchinsoni TaxID=1588748 RepID=A0A2J8BB29_9FIRM|nr:MULTISPECIES: L-serine ammonia-lyase, iron-sulfur-dependent subunit beta [Megasphaera]EGS31751.1 L-serine dehydratase, iron-sulfur-dependent, beta subunit [Megasphaera sp. UPII 135-E]MUP59553.1 L-serine ammonia-lyase, iron-sulfur-dependent, subunit beta [Veillonellaceae bacterium M2-4]PNH21973.1 L-serine dehydratase, iron-sulfur-dependent subunit beta [Megasphaera genomosp. type_2]
MGVFDVVGPVMIGPSSSHTAGAARIGLMARNILKEEPIKAEITVYGSFAKTYKGHGTDRALVAGLLGFMADDVRLRNSFEIAAQQGVDITLQRSDIEPNHPNTVRIAMTGRSGKQMEVMGVSLGGGKIEIREINGSAVALSGEEHTLITVHRDLPGIIAQATTIMATGNINVSNMRVFRSGKNAMAVMIVCTDSPVPEEMVQAIGKIQAIDSVVTLLPL